MFRLHIAATLLCLFFCLVLLASAVVFNDSNNPAKILLTAPENCENLCIFNIYPGQSTVREAMALLKEHSWVDDIVMNAPGTGYAEINWGWSDEHPQNVIDSKKRGLATFYYRDNPMDPSRNDSIIETVTLYTRIPIYAFQDWFGETDIGNVNRLIDGKLGYTVFYAMPGGIINFSTELTCPVTIVSYWNTTTRMTASIGSSNNPYISPSDMIRMC
jgi:hypothetical protein